MSSPAPPFSLRLLGGCSLESGEGLLAGRVAQRRRLAYLALVAVAGRRGVSRDKLAAYLWPEHGDDRARHLLSDTLYVLRSALGEQALVTVGEQIALNSAVVACDLVALESALERGDARGAVAAYGGPFLDGFYVSDAPEFERWVDAERERLAGAYAAALEELAQSAEHRGDAAHAVEWLRRLAAIRPYDGRTVRRLAEALEAAGDRAAAIRQVEVHAVLVRQDLETEPDPAVAQIAERLRAAPPRSLDRADASPEWRRPRDAVPKTEPTTDAHERPAVAAAPVRRGLRARARPMYPVLGLVALLGVVASYWRLGPSPGPPGAATAESPSVAVLPFADLSATPKDYFSGGVSEAILDALARLPTVQVVARTSSFNFKGRDVPAEEIGRALRVRYLVEGSVQWQGERVRIRAQLIDTRTGYRLWSNRYDREVRDIFELQEEIALAVADAVGSTLAATPGSPIQQPRTDIHVFESYLKGRYLWGRGEFAKAIPFFQAALSRDSAYAPAHAGLADSYARLEDAGMLPREEAYRRATDAARSALRLDGSLAEAHAALAHILMHRGRWSEADAGYRRALELNPSYATAHALYSMQLAGIGEIDRAIWHARRARTLDPLGAETALVSAVALRTSRQYEEAVAMLRTQLDLNPAYPPLHLHLGLTYLDMSRYAEAMSELEIHSHTTRSSRARVHLVRALALSGAKAAARDTLQAILRTAPGDQLQAIPVAAAYAALGDRDRAFEWLEKVVEPVDRQVLALRGPMADDLRADPRFPQLLRRLGLER